MFADRREAGRELAEKLLRFRDAAPIVLALPRGGVPVGFEIARRLGAPLDIVLVRKIGAPGQPEFGIGAVVDGNPPVVGHESRHPAPGRAARRLSRSGDGAADRGDRAAARALWRASAAGGVGRAHADRRG